jgi:hypothetical protein
MTDKRTSEALQQLAAMGTWSIRPLCPGRKILYLNGKRYGLWDTDRNEFVKKAGAKRNK